MRAINKWIIAKPIKEEVKTDSGLLLSAEDASNLRYMKGEVVVPGNLVEVIKEGDIIFFDKRSAFTMVIKGSTYTILSERDVVVVL